MHHAHDMIIPTVTSSYHVHDIIIPRAYKPLIIHIIKSILLILLVVFFSQWMGNRVQNNSKILMLQLLLGMKANPPQHSCLVKSTPGTANRLMTTGYMTSCKSRRTTRIELIVPTNSQQCACDFNCMHIIMIMIFIKKCTIEKYDTLPPSIIIYTLASGFPNLHK